MVEEVREDNHNEETPQEKIVPQEIKELYIVLEKIHSLRSTTKKLHDDLHSVDSQKKVQERLSLYSTKLGLVPSTLQLLNDLRRLIPVIESHSQTTQNNLVVLRGEEDAITSEEARVIVACASSREYIMNSIRALEYLLSHVRQTSHPLIELIGYHEPGFAKHVQQALPVLKLEAISTTLDNEHSRLASLCSDLEDLYAIDEHIEEVRNA